MWLRPAGWRAPAAGGVAACAEGSMALLLGAVNPPFGSDREGPLPRSPLNRVNPFTVKEL